MKIAAHNVWVVTRKQDKVEAVDILPIKESNTPEEFKASVYETLRNVVPDCMVKDATGTQDVQHNATLSGHAHRIQSAINCIVDSGEITQSELYNLYNPRNRRFNLTDGKEYILLPANVQFDKDALFESTNELLALRDHDLLDVILEHSETGALWIELSESVESEVERDHFNTFALPYMFSLFVYPDGNELSINLTAFKGHVPDDVYEKVTTYVANKPALC